MSQTRVSLKDMHSPDNKHRQNSCNNQDDPMFREHLDDTYFESENNISTKYFTKRLICEFLENLIENEDEKKRIKLEFIKLASEREVSMQQLFQRIDRQSKGYITHLYLTNFCGIESS